MKIKTYGLHEKFPDNIIFPTQTHGNNIVEIVTGDEDLSNCDGIWTKKTDAHRFPLGIKTADCAPITFFDGIKYGIIHAGWRGLCNGIIEKMCTNFENPTVWVGPILPQFEIQKDFCYELIYEKFGDRFFSTPPSPPCPGGELKIMFDFKSALQSVLPTAKFDPRSTYDDQNLASWRRDQDQHRNITNISP